MNPHTMRAGLNVCCFLFEVVVKSIFVSLTMALVSVNVQATPKNAGIELADKSVYSQVCYVAATQGIDAAREQFLRQFSSRIECNGQPINQFARQMRTVDVSQQPAYSAEDGNRETLICMQAIENPHRQFSQRDLATVRCNGKKLNDFIRAM